MRIDENTLNITVDQWDWGVPVIFEIKPDGDISLIGETVILAFDHTIADRQAEITSDDFDFSFALTKAEADAIYDGDIVNPIKIPYSLKRYKDGEYLDTIKNAMLIITRTVEWEQR